MKGERQRADRTKSERKIQGPMGETEREREDRTVTFVLRSLTKRGRLTATSTATAKRHLAFPGPLLPTQTGATIQAN
jgi:hypothetical protein